MNYSPEEILMSSAVHRICSVSTRCFSGPKANDKLNSLLVPLMIFQYIMSDFFFFVHEKNQLYLIIIIIIIINVFSIILIILISSIIIIRLIRVFIFYTLRLFISYRLLIIFLEFVRKNR